MLADLRYQDRAVPVLRRVMTGALTSSLFLYGPEGVGRKFSVMCMMRELLCTGDKTSSCECASCYQTLRWIHPDVVVRGSESEKIGVDVAREVQALAQQYPTASPFTCIILDGVDNFASGEATDMFLKLLEEPPPCARFFLLAQSRQRVSATILSRCIDVAYTDLPEKFIEEEVRKRTRDDAKALVYCRMGEGSLGRALRYAYSGKLSVRDHMLKLLEATAARDLPAMFSLVDAVNEDIELAVRVLGQIVHDIVVSALDPACTINVDSLEVLGELSKRISPQVWLGVFERTSVLLGQAASRKLVTPFHLKTILAETVV